MSSLQQLSLSGLIESVNKLTLNKESGLNAIDALENPLAEITKKV